MAKNKRKNARNKQQQSASVNEMKRVLDLNGTNSHSFEGRMIYRPTKASAVIIYLVSWLISLFLTINVGALLAMWAAEIMHGAASNVTTTADGKLTTGDQGLIFNMGMYSLTGALSGALIALAVFTIAPKLASLLKALIEKLLANGTRRSRSFSFKRKYDKRGKSKTAGESSVDVSKADMNGE